MFVEYPTPAVLLFELPMIESCSTSHFRPKTRIFATACSSNVETGGKPSTWFPPGTRRASPLPEKPLSLPVARRPTAHSTGPKQPAAGWPQPAARQCNRLFNRTAARAAGRAPNRPPAGPTADPTPSRPSAQPSHRLAGHTSNHPTTQPPTPLTIRPPISTRPTGPKQPTACSADRMLSQPCVSSRRLIQLTTCPTTQKAGRLIC